MVRPPLIERAAPAEALHERELTKSTYRFRRVGADVRTNAPPPPLVAQAIAICQVSNEAENEPFAAV